ncbi:YesL family protein [Fictibacillus terranigra]|uniref:YesL family protein n=1 Tax=Fictibacillus terranigra TaxID=3058424 RepID=A0ABT8EDJ5_9BACL|nr:YesL family protein [Fictibacillus sp. CENA-BCM004]MDN4076013.1 YesL family protein [Fictibacillus sp. CENA-BCM004]
MENHNLAGKLYRVCEWIMRLAYLNVLWIIFTLAGLILFGLFPSTAAMFEISRKWIEGETDLPVFTTFWRTYKKEFFKVQSLGLVLVSTGVIFFVDYHYMQSHFAVKESPFLIASMFSLIVFYLIAAMFIFPIYAYFQTNLLSYFKNALILGISYPVHSLVMAGGMVLIVVFNLRFPGFSLFLSGSLLSLWLTYIARNVFVRIAKRRNTGVKVS